jgi:hypothetical protein
LRKVIFLAYESLLFPFPAVFRAKVAFPMDTVRRVRWCRGGHHRASVFYKKSLAVRQLGLAIEEECQHWADKFGPVVVRKVIWRHTGGYGNQARNFLFVDTKNNICLIAKVGRRYRFFMEPQKDVDAVLSCLPDHLAESGVKAYFKFEQTSITSWFESVISFKEWKQRKQ